jgi:hypothetical protein
MPNLELVKADLTNEMEILVFEVSTLASVFDKTRFFDHSSNFPNAHYGYLMTCMGKIDVQSSYWSGQVGSQGQTHRMISFMNRYLYPGRTDEHRVSVQMFRHTLMHTGALSTTSQRKGIEIMPPWVDCPLARPRPVCTWP